MLQRAHEVTLTHGHLFCGSGLAAKGFNAGKARVGNLHARFECVGGIDNDPLALEDFEYHARAKGTLLDLFSREQWEAYHQREAPADFQEATPEDIRRAFGYRPLNVMVTSPPCPGFSGLLSEEASQSPKYKALNELTVRGLWLFLEAYRDIGLPGIILIENVPRIATRGRGLINQIKSLLAAFGFVCTEDSHDCGNLGNLAQSRKRWLLVARRPEIVPSFLYEPPKLPMRGVGEILGKMPMPDDPRAGPMHAMPSLQWQTWVRLAFVVAGSDWRSLNDLAVEDGVLRDFALAPTRPWRDGTLGVLPYGGTAGAVTAQAEATTGRFSVADPTPFSSREGSGFMGVRGWDNSAGTVTANGRPGSGPHSVADPRVDGHERSVQLGVRTWEKPAAVVKGDVSVGTGPYAFGDPRVDQADRAYPAFEIVPCDGGGARAPVQDPRATWGANSHANKLKVVSYGSTAPAVIGSDRVGSGAISVADPRPTCLNKPGRDSYVSSRHSGVLRFDQAAGAVPAHAKLDNGAWSVADPRVPEASYGLPGAKERMVCVIKARDGTWHRPFTTLDLAGLQSYFDPEVEFAPGGLFSFKMAGNSTAGWRHRIGNGIPCAAAAAIASVIGHTLLLSMTGQTFVLSNTPIWVRRMAIALAVDVPVHV